MHGVYILENVIFYGTEYLYKFDIIGIRRTEQVESMYLKSGRRAGAYLL